MAWRRVPEDDHFAGHIQTVNETVWQTWTFVRASIASCDKRLNELMFWIERDDNEGYYIRGTYISSLGELGFWFRFSDPNVALNFKLIYG